MALPSPEFHVTRWWSNQPSVQGYWGPSTSSIDWCFLGFLKCQQERLPLPLILCQVGIASIGVGSFLFHATLRYEWQLGDELPMIFCCAFIAYVTLDTRSASLPRTRFVRCLPYLFSIYAFGVTAIYIRYPNPLFHQVAFAFIQFVATFGTFYAIRTAPEKTYREQKNKADAWNYQLLGFFTPLAGFLVWNIDNIFCDQISQLKERLGTPWSFVLEGHAWWHLATGTGAYWSVVGLQLISMSLKEGAGGFELRRVGPFGLSPYVARISISVKPKAR
ncbi:hypothetical protein PCASD_11888 [Puccinia coronata f. sp. avenae]|uniref:Uncharacterized protein n=1 Tax=Puccinia coronata f. sp. avenae TaxID=200324 RepID=A0A2N5TD41_9BASI|nr:hypothetical protein PCASD_11888 [Puccinia coronata f. sp. avenae]